MKKITIIIIFLVGIILGVFIKSEYDSGKSKKVVVKQDYIFKGNVKVDEDTLDLRRPGVCKYNCVKATFFINITSDG